MQTEPSDKQQRIIVLERQLAVVKAKVEHLDMRARTMAREACAASTQAQLLRIKISRGEDELEAVKTSPAGEWAAAERKLRVVWDDVHKHLDDVATQVRNVLEN